MSDRNNQRAGGRLRGTRGAGRPQAWSLAGALWLALGSVLLAGNASAARPSFREDPDYIIETWGAEEGWPAASARAMAQTPDGYLWVGTLEGLVRFDGVKFSVFDQSNLPLLPSRSVTKLHVDRKGNLWVATIDGVAVRHGADWRAVALPGTNDDHGNYQVVGFAERPGGGLLVATRSGGVLQLAGSEFHALPPPPGQTRASYSACADGAGNWRLAQRKFVGKWQDERWIETVSLTELPDLQPKRVRCSAARDGGWWLMLGSELRHYRGETETSRTLVPGLKGAVADLREDSRGNVWVCTEGSGLWEISRDHPVRHWSTATGLPDDVITFAFEDGQNDLWVGSEQGGLTRFHRRTFQSVLTVTNRSSFTRFALAPCPTGGVFVASFRQGLWHAGAGDLTRVPLPKPFREDAVSALSLLVDRAGRIWIGSMTDGVWKIDGQDARRLSIDKSGEAPITKMFEDSHGRIWLAGGESIGVFEAGGMRTIGPGQGLPPGPVHGFAEDRGGGIWLTHDRGVFRWATNRWTPVLEASGGGLRMSSVWADADGTVWMDSTQAGVACWHEGHLFRRRLPPALSVHEVWNLLEDGRGVLWMTSPQGVLAAGKQDLEAWLEGKSEKVAWHPFDRDDGLPSAECTDAASDTEGRLWFATARGVARVEPSVELRPSRPPRVRIEELTYHRAAGRVYAGPPSDAALAAVGARLEWPLPRALKLPPGSRRLQVQYTALDCVACEDVRFQTRLDPGDADWQDVGERRVAYYYDFNPGSYVFRVRAVNREGAWSQEEASLAFTVQPTLWQTGWIKLLGVGAVASVVYGGVRRRVTGLKKERAAQRVFTRQLILSQESERKRVAAELHDGLGQNLLLIKNRLVLAAGRRADAAELTRQLDAAKEATDRAIGEVRAISRALRPVALDQIGLTKAVEWMIEQLRESSPTVLSSELENIDGLLDPELEMHLFRVIQEGLSNITRHAGAQRAIVEMKREGAELRVSLFDDGRGFDTDKLENAPSPSGGMGLTGMKERVAVLGGRLDLQSSPGLGTRLTVRVPLPPLKT